MAEQGKEKALRHELLAARLRAELSRHGVAGDRLPPDPVQAKQYGVSVITWRNAIGILEKEGLVHRRRGSGTYIADIRRQSSGRVAVICSDRVAQAGAGSGYWHLLLHSLRQCLREAGFTADIHFDMEGELEMEVILRPSPEAPLAGIVVVDVPPAAKGLAELQAHGVPLVSCCKRCPGVFKIDNDHYGMVREATRTLIQRGRRRLALVTRYKDGSSHTGIDDWMEEAFMGALAQAGVELVPEWVCAIDHGEGPGIAFNRFRELWHALPAQPDGVLITDDSIFPEVAMAILEMAIDVPDELLVATHANVGAAMFCPFPALRFAFDPQLMAQTLTRKLQESLAGQLKGPPFAILPFELLDEHTP